MDIDLIMLQKLQEAETQVRSQLCEHSEKEEHFMLSSESEKTEVLRHNYRIWALINKQVQFIVSREDGKKIILDS